MKAVVSSEHGILGAVADDYRRQGYTVKLHPKRADLPSFTKSLRPDLVAVRGAEKRLIVIKDRFEVASKPVSSSLIERMKEHPGWALEFYYVKGQRDVLETIEETQALRPKEIAKRTSEARKLLLDGHWEAALVLVWSALEAVMRNFAAKRNLKIRGGAEAISSSLVASGYLNHSHHRLFQQVVPIRNALVHGFRNPEVNNETILRLIETVPVIQRELRSNRQARAS
jgi:uncharacterized protein YutE (UPF0331/DUF86 family)